MIRMTVKLFITTIVFVLIMLGAMYHYVQPGKSPIARKTGGTAPPDEDDKNNSQLSRWWRKFQGDGEPVQLQANKSAAVTTPPVVVPTPPVVVQPTCKRIWQKGRSSWFDSRFDDNIRPVWSRANIELPADARKWWMSLQSHKDEDPAPLLNALFDMGAPDVDPWASRNLTGCLRCAVVGNSGNLRQSNYGEEIDGYDLIFRMNDAPTKGWEKDVGHRTTHHFMYPESATDLPDDVSFVLLNFKPLDLKWMKTSLTDGSITRTWTRVKGRIKANKTKILVYNPAFFKYVNDKWTEHHGRYSSTGSLVILFAVHVCDEVDVYGYGADKLGNWNHYWTTHYSGAAHRSTGVHDSEFERVLLEKLQSEGIIKIHRGNAANK
ncbi:CMP-N-acetylneuraminate-beta-galactosamide-alpha-2,3-sialyltransferase 2-like isoform X1 [Branchiostoma floridae]|uniref:CMP-N-acetylneuraminate-beta-galactosamide-alpha-2,3-sialyltransferase 1 n=1 Tax=Branchiostoma floridae TaxID=7739 RepID=A0A9J7LB70_BRAFL|nr:CMP-N-acetylneuraminate-beta-galactosamide-alpha-2,3-sialyltransferase 2-like isoform X1 [Branchiostoma floridae]